MKNVAFVLSGLLAGVVAGTLLIPLVHAEAQRPTPVKWQQFCEPAASINEASGMAAARGVQGWELVGFFGGALCFKRPVADASRAGGQRDGREGEKPWPGGQDGI